VRSLAWLLCWLPACTLVRPLDELSSEPIEPAFQTESPGASGAPPDAASAAPLASADDPFGANLATAGSGPTAGSGNEGPGDTSYGLDSGAGGSGGGAARDAGAGPAAGGAAGSVVGGADGGFVAPSSISDVLDPSRPSAPADAGAPGAPADLCRSDTECVEGRCLEAGGGCQPCPEEMSLARFQDGTAFCIDRLEVTQSQYQEFLATVIDRPDAAAREVCEQNPSLFPSEEGACGGVFQPAATPELPVSCVDACDALAYCHWAGKRLCGKKNGGLMTRGKAGDPGVDEWQVACTERTSRLYPYDGSFSSDACNVAGDAAARVGAAESCSTESGVSDLSGNVSEWSDCCDVIDGELRCATRGGSFAHQNPLGVACNPIATDGVDPPFAPPFLSQQPHVGIRCCAN